MAGSWCAWSTTWPTSSAPRRPEMSGDPNTRLTELGLSLPAVPVPQAAYITWARSGDLVLTAGQLPMVDGKLVRTGKLGADVTTDEGARLARTAALNLL